MNSLKSFISNLKISKKFTYMGAVFFIIFILVISGSMALVIRNVLGDNLEDQIAGKSRIMEENFKLKGEQALSAAEWFSTSARLIDAYRSGRRDEAIKIGQLAMKSIGLDYFLVTDLNGNVFMRAHTPDKYGDSIIQQVNIKKALKGERSVGIEEGSVVRFSIRAGAPLIDKSGKIIGAISLGYILSNNDFVDRQKALLGSEITVFHGDERVSTTIKDSSGKRIIGTRLGIPVISDVVLKQGKSYYGQALIQGKKFYTAYIPLVDTENKISGMLFIGDEASMISGLIKKLIAAITIIICIAGTAFLLSFHFFLKNTVISRLNRVNERLGEIAEGDGDLTVRIDEVSGDEIGELSSSFNRFVDKIRNVIADIKRVSVELNSMVGELNNSTMVFSDNSQNQASSVEEVNATTEELSAGMEMISDNTKIQTESMHSLMDRMRELSDLINETGRSINETLKLGATMSEEARKGENSLRSMTESMVKIEESSSQVYSIIKIINDISEQINLLSLNAAIESARAGDAGRGFAVVADEISKLADQTAGSIKDINRLIKSNEEEIRNGSSKVDDAGRIFGVIIHGVESVSSMMNSISGFMTRQIAARDEMTHVSEVVSVKTEEIKSATGEHRISTEEIVKATSSINEMTQSIAGAAEEMASMAEEIAAMSETLKSRVEFFKV